MPLPAKPGFEDGPEGPTYGRGKRWPVWFILALPFTALLAPLWHAARRRIRWKACLAAIVLFEVIQLPLEHSALIRGHWVYNEHRILGPRIWGVPIEEPLLYYWYCPLFVILVFEALTGLYARSIRLGARTLATLEGLGGHFRRRPIRATAITATGLAALVLPFVYTPVSNWLDRRMSAASERHVLLRYRLVGDREVRCFNAGEQVATRLTLEVTYRDAADRGGVAVHVPRRVESRVVVPPPGADPDVAVTVERLFPRESDGDDEYVSIRTPGPIRGVQFVAAEGRAKPEAGAVTPATATGSLPLAELP